MRSDFVFQETRWLPLERRSDFSGIKDIMKTLLRHAKIFPPTPIWNIFSYHILPPLVRASIAPCAFDEVGELGDFFSFFANTSF